MSVARQFVSLANGTNAPLAFYDDACRAISKAKAVDELRGIHDASKAMAAAARIAKNRQAETDMMEIRFRAERRIGELMAAQRGSVGLNNGSRLVGPSRTRQDDKPTLAEAGIDKHLADRARKYAAIPEREFDAKIGDYRQRVLDEGDRARADLLATGEKHVRGTFGTGENEWYTPPEYIELARNVLGAIDLDPASTEQANTEVKAGKFYSLADDGLAQKWFGRVWMNPPYAQPAIAQFAGKAVTEWQAGNIEAAIILTHNYTDTAWFHAMASVASAICFTRSRVRFVSPDGDLAAPTQGQAFFYIGHDPDRFFQVFRDVGFVGVVRQ